MSSWYNYNKDQGINKILGQIKISIDNILNINNNSYYYSDQKYFLFQNEFDTIQLMTEPTIMICLSYISLPMDWHNLFTIQQLVWAQPDTILGRIGVQILKTISAILTQVYKKHIAHQNLSYSQNYLFLLHPTCTLRSLTLVFFSPYNPYAHIL